MSELEKATAQDPTEPRGVQMQLQLPEILDRVDYNYANHARLSGTKWDIRIAFGDIGPTGKIEPKGGIILSHIVAKGLQKALERMVEQTEERMGEIVDPTEGQIEIAVEAEESDLKPLKQAKQSSAT